MRVGKPRFLHAGLMSLLLTLALAGCGGGAHEQPNALKTTAPILNWRKLAPPTNVDRRNSSISVSRVNGRNAWLCAPDSSGQFLVWRTQDAGMTWSQTGAFPSPAPASAMTQLCSMSADQNLDTGVAFDISWGSGNSPAPEAPGAVSYYSADGGAHWTEAPKNQYIQQVATSGNITYAIVEDTANNYYVSVVASSSQLSDWRVIDPTILPAQSNGLFWAATSSGALLWADPNSTSAFHSSDQGTTWTTALTQSSQQVSVNLAVWRGQSAGWLMCGFLQSSAGNGADASQTLCSADMGKTWTVRKNLLDTWECAHCTSGGASSGVHPCVPNEIAPDGALYATCGNDPQDTGAPPTPWVFSRLPLGASAWRTVGQAPCASVTTTQTGQAWCIDPTHGDYVLDQLP